MCGGNPFLQNNDPLAMAGHHTASWEYLAGNGGAMVRFYSWSGVTANGKKRYWTYRLPPGFNQGAAPNIQLALFANPVWPTMANPNGTNVYVATVTDRGWIQAETFNDTPRDGGGRGFCEGQFKAASYAMMGIGNMEDPAPNIACVWLNFAPGRKTANPNADCHNLCQGRANLWPGWPYSGVFKAACDAQCDTCLPPPPCVKPVDDEIAW